MNNIYSLLQYGGLADTIDPTILIVMAFGVLFVSGIMIYQGRNESTSYEDLEANEQDVIDIIRDNGNMIRQKEISNQLEWKDTRTSRITSSLLKNNVVEKIREDRENYIKISETFEEE